MRTWLAMLASLGCAVSAGASGSSPMPAGGPASVTAAAALVRMMDSGGLKAVAAADPADSGTFVAALYAPDSPLMVVSARHPSVESVLYRIASRQYRETYLDLQGTPTPAGKFFVIDTRADGLLAARPNSGEADIVYDGEKQTVFNGDPKSQHISEGEYEARLSAADARYARMLTLLANAIAAPVVVSAR